MTKLIQPLAGINIDVKASYSVSWIRGKLGVEFVRFVLTKDNDLRGYLDQLLAAGGKPVAVLAKESLAGFTDVVDAIRFYIARYGPRISIWIIGNEPDAAPNSLSSWIMSTFTFDSIADKCLKELRFNLPQAQVFAGGFCSGTTIYAKQLTTLPRFDGISIHVYTKRPEPDFPDSNWGTGFVGDLITAFINDCELPVLIGEYGCDDPDENFCAEYNGRMTHTLLSDFRIVGGILFCASDKMVDKFGILRIDGTEKPSVRTVQLAVKNTPRYVLGFLDSFNTHSELLGRPIMNEKPFGGEFNVQMTENGILFWAAESNKKMFLEGKIV